MQPDGDLALASLDMVISLIATRCGSVSVVNVALNPLTVAFNLLTVAFNLLTVAFNLLTVAFNPLRWRLTR